MDILKWTENGKTYYRLWSFPMDTGFEYDGEFFSGTSMILSDIFEKITIYQTPDIFKSNIFRTIFESSGSHFNRMRAMILEE